MIKSPKDYEVTRKNWIRFKFKTTKNKENQKLIFHNTYCFDSFFLEILSWLLRRYVMSNQPDLPIDFYCWLQHCVCFMPCPFSSVHSKQPTSSFIAVAIVHDENELRNRHHLLINLDHNFQSSFLDFNCSTETAYLQCCWTFH